ncbi:putative inactive receptor-like protein kinase At1g64210 [Phoenix dactylifera]|uniref:Inactive receptor-like protein kinase At1g64210 n=1 Tax=Phoenix dactylifera TaxID=42345 RepID=A0A8B7BK70_PHODC|nr:putative inactive receptor-like protein kinase At1g64210 [Phoenix dactylifera]
MGIKCDVLSLHVTEIRLENMNISGRIDADSLCKLPSLQFLSLAINHITGDIPESMSNCLGLTYLNLSSNMLNGKVPASMESLKNLRSFDISNNNLTGYIPHFKQEIELVYHNTMISGMSVNETDPAIKASDDKIRDNVNQPKAPTLAWSITILTLVLLITFFSLFIFFTDKKNPKVAEVKESKKCVHESSARNYTTGTEDDIEKGGKVQDLVFFGERQEKFTMDDLLTSAADLQGRNIYSSLYKIRLKNSSIFVVKRLKNLHVSGDDFKQKVMRIGNLKHPNLLPLVACHSSDHDKLLIYRYQNSGSLSSLFSSYVERKVDIPWKKRLSIMSGIARGLDYIARELDEDCAPHGNLKPSNVLLGETEEPLISEFGILNLLYGKRALLYSSYGYRAPEKELTKKADVFSFGVILLELLTGKIVEKSGINLPGWVKSMVREEWTAEVFDAEVNRVGKQWAFPLLNVALKCVSYLPEHRPDISEVLEKIEHVVNSEEDHSISSPSSVESDQQDHMVVPKTSETPGN